MDLNKKLLVADALLLFLLGYVLLLSSCQQVKVNVDSPLEQSRMPTLNLGDK